MNYYMEINNAIPIGPLYTEPILKDKFPDIDINNLPNNFLKVEYTNPPTNITNYKIEFVIDGNVVKMIYTTL